MPRHRQTSRASRLAVAGLVAGSLVLAGQAAAAGGGITPPGSAPNPATTGPVGKAKLLRSGKAIPPRNAPRRIVRAIKAANRIRKKPYRYGGGHRSFKSKGYDCSGAVSYVLHAAKMLRRPLPSGWLARWGRRGKGRWITVYAHGGHTYAVIAGLRWDTSAINEPARAGSGPRWRRTKRSPRGYKVRHFPRF